MKLYNKDKLKIIEMYEQGITQKSIALQYEVNLTTINRILSLYRKHGLEILRDKVINAKYSPEFKLELVTRVSNGESKGSIGAEFGINVGTIFSWCKKYNDLGYNGLKQDLRGAHMTKKPKSKEIISISDRSLTNEEKIKLLEAENEQLKMELDLTKKLRALVQQRKEQPIKKK